MESKELLVPNPLLYSVGLRKYIWINDLSENHRNAQYLFGYLMRKDIYIDGFATSSAVMTDLRMYNKKIYDFNSLKQENAAVFYEIWFKDIWKTYEGRGYRARLLNPELGKENIVIWGSGITGENVFRLLEEAGIKVCFFVDSDRNLLGTVKCGIPVCSPDVLEEDFVIVEAMEKWHELDREISVKYPKRFHFSFDVIWDQIMYSFDGIQKNVFNLSDFWPCNRFAGKRMYIYGIGAIERAYAVCLRLLDYQFIGFLADEETELEDSEYPVMRVEDILYEENYYIWVYDKEKSWKLKELGLKYYFEYECAVCAYGIATEAKFSIDVNLGHTYRLDSKYSGFIVHGEEMENDYKIAVLGGSTTDGAAFPFKSWPQMLYEKLGKQGITIYNGGVSGYTSGQELVKLIRDILSLKPNMIVVYDGFNELNTDTQYPFAFPYAKKVVNYAAEHLEEDIQGCYESILSLGVQSKRNFFSNWLLNLKNMHAVSKENNIDYLAFCQPELSSKRGKTMQEKNMLLSAPAGYSFTRKKEEFRNCIEKISKLPDYIYDLSYIFDGESDIYMDSCHVWEKGNRIIAEEIAKIVLPKINNYKDGKK